MKVSSVLRGIKSWVDRFHHPLPLDRKESSRLLTALTTSFRQHLDEVHPSNAAVNSKSAGPAAKATGNNVSAAKHSAAVAADRHMSSILTNSLLSDGALKAQKTSKIEGPDLHALGTRLSLSQADPLDVLGEFSQRSQATAAVASLCMRAFDKNMKGFTTESKHEYIRTHEPGRRVLSWLQRTELYATPQMVREDGIMTLLVPYLLIEGREVDLWKILRIQQGQLHEPDLSDPHSNIVHFKWKSKMLSRLVQYHCNRGRNLNNALEAFLKATECDDLIQQRVLFQAGRFLFAMLTDPERNDKYRTVLDVAKYDAFINHQHTWADARCCERHTALLVLYHPLRPSPDMLVKYLRREFMDPTKEKASILLDILRQSARPPADADVRHMLSTAKKQLQDRRSSDDLAWLCLTLRHLYPDLMNYTHETAINTSQPSTTSQTKDSSPSREEPPLGPQDHLWWRSPSYG